MGRVALKHLSMSDDESYQLMTINAVYSKHAEKMSKFNTCIFFPKKCPNTSKNSHAHLQRVHNNCARFEECQPKGAGGFDYTT
jgi:hypothetical protein